MNFKFLGFTVINSPIASKLKIQKHFSGANSDDSLMNNTKYLNIKENRKHIPIMPPDLAL